MEKFTLSKMNDKKIQEFMDSVEVDDYELSGDEYIIGDDESMDDEMSREEPGPSSKSCRKYTSERRQRKLVSSSESGDEDPLEGPTSRIFVDDPSKMSTTSNEFKKIVWRKQDLQLRKGESTFTGNNVLPEEIRNLRTPYDFFMYFFTEKLIEEIVSQTNHYAHQKHVESKFNVSPDEMKKFIGILMFMSVYRYPNIRSYWEKYSFEEIRNAMSRNKFDDIRSSLHFRDTSSIPKKGESGYDVLYRIRPLIDHFNERFGSVPMLTRLCVDEQMCSTKMRGTSIRQYMPNKLHKWGLKLFVLRDTAGFSYAFEVYTGAGDRKILENAPDLGASSNVGIRLTRNVPSNVNHIVNLVGIPWPNIISEYNKHMGGVDLMDGLIDKYHIRVKTWKWTVRIFYDLLDISLVNAYVLYNRVYAHEKIKLPVFRSLVAESLCLRTVSQKTSVGRPKSTTPPKPKRAKRAYLPQDDLRYDRIGHWCIFRDRTEKKQCKNPGCKSETQAFCVKCDVNLCNSPVKTCFYDFHHKEN